MYNRDRGFYLGLTGVVWGLASGTGPLLGGALTEYVSWRWNWWINLPCCCLSFLVLCFSLPNHRSNTNLWKALWKIDWLGILAVLGLSIMTLLGLNFGGVFAPWSSPKVLCLITFGILVGFVFLLYEAKLAKDPLIPMRILYRLSNNASLLVCFTHGFVSTSISIAFLQINRHAPGQRLLVVFSTPILPSQSFLHPLPFWTPPHPHNRSPSTHRCRRRLHNSSYRNLHLPNIHRHVPLYPRIFPLHPPLA